MDTDLCLKCKHILSRAEPAVYGLHPDCFTQWFEVPTGDEFQDVVRRASGSEDALSSQNKWNTSFFQGKFRKYSASLGERHYIIKVKQSIAPELPEVEYLCNQIATCIELPVPDYFLIKLFGKTAFITRNFLDLYSAPATLNHIYHYLDEKQNYDCETLLNIIKTQTGYLRDIEIFIHCCLYDILIGNHDRHGKNLAFVVKGKQSILSPIYDNTSALGLEFGDILNAQFSPRGKIATPNSLEPVVIDYVQEFIRLGYKEYVRVFINNRVNIKFIQKLIENSFCSDLMKKAMIKLITSRYEDFKNAL